MLWLCLRDRHTSGKALVLFFLTPVEKEPFFTDAHCVFAGTAFGRPPSAIFRLF
jgi:hypothetical protein